MLDSSLMCLRVALRFQCWWTNLLSLYHREALLFASFRCMYIRKESHRKFAMSAELFETLEKFHGLIDPEDEARECCSWILQGDYYTVTKRYASSWISAAYNETRLNMHTITTKVENRETRLLWEKHRPPDYVSWLMSRCRVFRVTLSFLARPRLVPFLSPSIPWIPEIYADL